MQQPGTVDWVGLASVPVILIAAFVLLRLHERSDGLGTEFRRWFLRQSGAVRVLVAILAWVGLCAFAIWVR